MPLFDHNCLMKFVALLCFALLCFALLCFALLWHSFENHKGKQRRQYSSVANLLQKLHSTNFQAMVTLNAWNHGRNKVSLKHRFGFSRCGTHISRYFNEVVKQSRL